MGGPEPSADLSTLPWGPKCLEIRNSEHIKYSKSTAGYIQRTESKDSNIYMHTRVHGCITHSSQKVEAIQMSIKR